MDLLQWVHRMEFLVGTELAHGRDIWCVRTLQRTWCMEQLVQKELELGSELGLNSSVTLQSEQRMCDLNGFVRGRTDFVGYS